MDRPRERDLIQHSRLIARRGVELLRDNSSDEGALREVRRTLMSSIRNARITDRIRSTEAQATLLRRMEEILVGLNDQVLSAAAQATRVVARPAGRIYGAGRPKLDIQEGTIRQMMAGGLNGKGIADALGCSVRTLARRLAGLDITLRKDGNSDEVVGEAIRQSRLLLPGAGASVIHGHLVSKDVEASRDQVRRLLRQQDPYGGAQRQSKMIIRRRYHVAGPGALFHMDGNAKLNMYGIWTEGCIDGFSRKVIFCVADTNNRAHTVRARFLACVAQNGIPSRLRTDRGMENFEVGRFMLETMGVNRGSIITGKSVHNQRIERWWRDLTSTVTRFFKQLFIQMEQCGVLDATNDMHLMILHFMYLPRINESIREFVSAWNHHKIRTADYKSPEQIWQNARLRGDTYGKEWDGPMPEELPLNRSDFADEYPEEWDFLTSQVDPLEEDDNVGVSLFQHCKDLLGV